jgi:radical SAM superfamily enzyme
MKKQFSLADVRRSAHLLRRYRIRMMGFLMLGGPGETRESAEESLAFAESLDLDTLKISIGIRIYPGTDVARIAEQEGIIRSEQDLLFPKFYVVRDLQEWLFETVASRLSNKPNWIL